MEAKQIDLRKEVLDSMHLIGGVLEGKSQNVAATCIALIEIAAQVAAQGALPEEFFLKMLKEGRQSFLQHLEDEAANVKH